MNHALGREGEAFAAQYLKDRGYEIFYTNFRIRGSEIDIITKKSNKFIFIEVKTRSNSAFGSPKDSINVQKLKHILRGIEYFFYVEIELDETPDFQIDLISLKKSQEKFVVEHIENIGFDDF